MFNQRENILVLETLIDMLQDLNTYLYSPSGLVPNEFNFGYYGDLVQRLISRLNTYPDFDIGEWSSN